MAVTLLQRYVHGWEYPPHTQTFEFERRTNYLEQTLLLYYSKNKKLFHIYLLKNDMKTYSKSYTNLNAVENHNKIYFYIRVKLIMYTSISAIACFN